MTQSLHDNHFPNETREYREARNELLLSERELRRQIERVAAQRRALPLGGAAKDDYVFDEVVAGNLRQVKLSELFGAHNTLGIYSFMYSPRDGARPCPMCTSMLDGLDGQVKHITQNTALAIVARAPIDRVMAFARERGWRDLRLVSSLNNTFNSDYFGETANGDQITMFNVFTRRDGKVFHTWSSELRLLPADPGQDGRHIDSIWPLWNVLDMTPEGRGANWRPKLEY